MDSKEKNLAQRIEFNRRNFLKLVVGGAAGINLTPLPWKLTDDIAIWTQNWPWLPVPSVGAFNQVDSICRLCPGGCGISVQKVDNRAVKIEGRTDYPVNPGGICPLGAGGLQLLYNENVRFTGPMKRVGPRGAGEFVAISWNAALGELADKIRNLRQQQSPEALGAIDGNSPRSTMSHMIRRFLETVGSPNYVRVPTVEDTYRMVNRLMLGSDGPMAFDLENADFILSFGCGLIEGWGAPGRVINAWSLWRGASATGKVKIVQIESRASNTASKADQWFAPRPGTEAALALGLAHVIIREDLFDKNFVYNYTHGFMDWTGADGKDHMGFRTLALEKYTPGHVASLTGLNANDIVSVARAFGRSKAPIALMGKSKGYLNGSIYEFMAIQSLNALVGNVNKPGGVLVHEPIPFNPWTKVVPDGIAQKGLGKARLDQAGSLQYPFSESLINNLSDLIIRSERSPLDTILIFSANPVHNLPDGGHFKNALKKVPYIVSFSPYRDETSYMADLVLPDHNDLEKRDDVAWPTGLQYPLYGLSQPVVEPLYNTRRSGDVMIQLAKLIGNPVGPAFPWATYEEAIKVRVKGLFESGNGLTRYDGSQPVWKSMAGMTAGNAGETSFDEMWEKMTSGGFWYRPSHKFGNWETIFRTPTGKFEFSCTGIEWAIKELARDMPEKSALQKMGIGVESDEAVLPHYEAPASPEDENEYPLLMVPYALINLSSGWLPNPPYANKTLFDSQLRKMDSFVKINPKSAAQFDLKQGDVVLVESSRGSLKVRVDLFEGAMPGVVYVPLGFGHRAYDAYQKDKGANPNDIIVGGMDPLSGNGTWWETRVKIKKI